MMKRLRSALLATVLVVPFVGCVPVDTGPQPMTSHEIYQHAQTRAVTVLLMKEEGEQVSHGSGFFVSPTYIMTANHVVQNRENRTVIVLTENNQHAEARVVFVDQGNDIAILEVPPNETAENYSFGTDSTSARDYYIYGHPLNHENDILTNATFAGYTEVNGAVVVVLNGYAAPGMSGGPVVNEYGNVVGMIILRGTEPLPFPPGASYGIPICGVVSVEHLVEALRQLDNIL